MIQVLFAALAAAAYMDLRHEKIPNLLIITSLILSGILFLKDRGPQAILSYLFCAALPLLILYPVWYLTDGGIAAGDIKLLMVVSSCTGVSRFLNCFVCSFLVAAIPAVMSFLINLNHNAEKSCRSQRQALSGRVRLALPILIGTAAAIFMEGGLSSFVS